MKTFYIIILFFTCYLNSIATVHYVSKEGNSVPPYLSWENAAYSIQDAINASAINDTIIIDNGVYTEKLRLNIPITIVGIEQDSVIISGEGISDTTIYTTSNLILKNLSISRGKFGVWLDNATLNISYCNFSHHTYAIRVSDANTTIRNSFSDTDNTFFTFWNENDTSYTIIEDCILKGTKGKSGDGLFSTINNNLKLSNNIFYGSWSGYGIYAVYCNKVQINNNLFYNERLQTGILVDFVSDSISVTNNVVIGLRNEGITTTLGDKGIVRNNIFMNCKRAINTYPFDKNQADYNLFYNNETDYFGGVLPGLHDIHKNPMFVNIPDPEAIEDFDFHLQAFSPGIDTGDPEILDVDGTRSDMGLFGGPEGEITLYSDFPPAIPSKLNPEFDTLTNVLDLLWQENDEADFSYYSIYRDTISNFEANISNRIALQDSNRFLDTLLNVSKIYYYQITAIDSQNNESASSRELEIVVNPITSVKTKQYFNYRIDQNYPNPFNPKTKIGYSLKEAGNVKISVYDIKGEKISTITEGFKLHGHHEVDFDGANLASGIYIYKITVSNQKSMPIFIHSKKMILIK